MRTMTVIVAALVVALGVVLRPGLPSAAGGDPPPPQATELTQARALIDKKDYAQAVPFLKAAAAKQPSSADAWNLMGYAHRKLGQFGPAEEYYGKALAIDSAHLGALEYLGELYVETGRLADARKMLKRLDDACFFGCKEFDDLKRAIEGTKASDAGAQPQKW